MCDELLLRLTRKRDTSVVAHERVARRRTRNEKIAPTLSDEVVTNSGGAHNSKITSVNGKATREGVDGAARARVGVGSGWSPTKAVEEAVSAHVVHEEDASEKKANTWAS